MAIAPRGASAHLGGMDKPIKRATRRPPGFAKPAHWTNEPPPEPAAAKPDQDSDGLDPTRFGDWEKNGIAIDF